VHEPSLGAGVIVLNMYTLPMTGTVRLFSSMYRKSSSDFFQSQPTCVIKNSAPEAIFFSIL